MLERIRRLPSPALVVSAIALAIALGGGSYALASLNTGKVKRIAKKVANKQISGRAPGLTVGNAAHAASATSATNSGHATTADSATNAGNADTFGGLTPSLYSRANTYSGYQPTAVYNGSVTNATLTTPSIAPGAYLLIARAEPDQTGFAGALTMHCNLTGPSGAGLDTATTAVLQNQDGEVTLVGTDTSSSAGSAIVGCNVPNSHAFNLFAQLSVVRLGSETHSGTMTPGT